MIYTGNLPFTCPYGRVLGEKFHPAISPDAINNALLFSSRTFPRGEGGMFQAYSLARRGPVDPRRGHAEDQSPTLFTGQTHVTPDGAYLVEAETLSAVGALM
jgi:hypothetical protein